MKYWVISSDKEHGGYEFNYRQINPKTLVGEESIHGAPFF
jgi:hypothetical protein